MAKDKNLKKMKKVKKEVNKTYKEWQEMKPEISAFRDEIYGCHQDFEEMLKKLDEEISKI